MEENNKDKLAQILAKKKTQEDKAQLNMENAMNERKKFINSFNEIVKTMIEPKMEEIGAILNENNRGYSISINDKEVAEKGFYTKPFINMNISSHNDCRTAYPSTDSPHIMFIGDVHNKSIMIHECTISPAKGGQAGMKSKKYIIESLTPEIVEKEIINSIERIFE